MVIYLIPYLRVKVKFSENIKLWINLLNLSPELLDSADCCVCSMSNMCYQQGNGNASGEETMQHHQKPAICKYLITDDISVGF